MADMMTADINFIDWYNRGMTNDTKKACEGNLDLYL